MLGEMLEFLNPPAPAGMQRINKLTLKWIMQAEVPDEVKAEVSESGI